METVLVLLGTCVFTVIMLAGFLVWYFNHRVKPYLDGKVEEFRQISKEMEENIRKGVKKGVHESFKEMPSATVKETTRSMVKLGSGLVEGGISSIFRDK